MVLRFFLLASVFFFVFCTNVERDDPDDKKGNNYSSAVVFSSSSKQSSSPSVASSSSVAVVGCPNAVTGNGTVSCGGQTYKTVKIGTQTWMAENLNYNVSGSKCYGEDGKIFNKETQEFDITLSSSEIQANCDKYGRFYDWGAANAACPSGWHLPSYVDWDVLLKFVDNAKGGNGTEDSCDAGTGTCYNSNTAGKYLKATSGWNGNGNGLDSYGFSALPGGSGNSCDFRYDDDACHPGGSFFDVGNYGKWWSSPETISIYDDGSMIHSTDNIYWYNGDRSGLFSVRCLQDSLSTPSSSSVAKSSSSVPPQIIYGPSVTYQGETYQTVVIGTQTWFKRNLNYAVSGSKCYDNKESNCATYGRLYDWATAMGLDASCNSSTCSGQVTTKHKGICPDGWHIPSDGEWTILTNNVGSPTATKLKSASGWNTGPGYKAGTDNYGFSALPGGFGSSNGGFDRVGFSGFWCSASEATSDEAYLRVMDYGNEYVNDNYAGVYYFDDKSSLVSVRCLQD